MSTLELGNGYTARPLTLEAYREACARLEDRIFGGNWLYAFGEAARPPAPLGESFQWGVYHGDTLVGWHHAHQRDGRTVYMADTGLLPEHVTELGATPGWLRYRLPRRAIRRNDKLVCVGQKQVWFLLKLTGSDADLRLDASSHPEFDHWRWVDFWYPVEHVVTFKRGVYARALRHLARAGR